MLLTVFVIAVMQIFPKALIGLFVKDGASEEVIKVGVSYLRIYIAGLPANMLCYHNRRAFARRRQGECVPFYDPAGLYHPRLNVLYINKGPRQLHRPFLGLVLRHSR
jgi:hypothetical protein